MKNSKELKKLIFLFTIYTKLFDNGNFHYLIIPIKKIKKINQIYKKNFKIADTLTNLIKEFDDNLLNLHECEAAYLTIQKQFELKKALQPAILTECYVAKTIADIFELKTFVSSNGEDLHVPSKIGKILFRSVNIDNADYRYIYYNDKKQNMCLYQCGSSNTIDIIFADENATLRIEIKEEKSKLEEVDLLYDDEGMLIYPKDFIKSNSSYVPLIKEFNRTTSIFDKLGHNFNLKSFISTHRHDIATSILKGIMEKKHIDLYVLIQKNIIYPCLPEDLFKNVSIEKSEIRTSGRNGIKVFTKEYLNKILCDNNNKAVIDNDEISVIYNQTSLTKGRNKNEITRYKLNNSFYVKTGDYKLEEIQGEKRLVFKRDKIWQLKPTISLHLDIFVNSNILKNRVDELRKLIEKYKTSKK